MGGEEGGSEINGTIAVEFIFSKSKARLLNKVKKRDEELNIIAEVINDIS